MIPKVIFVSAVEELLGEAYVGPANPSATWFVDNAQGSGLLGTLESLSAQAASVPFGANGTQGLTIAAHAEHLRWSLALSNALARGESHDPHWENSWSVTGVEPEQWDKLRVGLRDEFEALRAVANRIDMGDSEAIIGAIAVVAHGAYHLGVIRLMVRLLP